MAKEYRYLGKATKRMDAEDIVTGKAKYLNDLKLANVLHGKALRSPYSHAKITGIDVSKAEALPGVKAVLTYKNVPDWKGGLPHHLPVLDSKVRFVGDAVALVAAETEEIAEEALELIDVEYKQLQAVYDVDEAIKPGAPQLWDQFPNNIATPGCPAFGPKCLTAIELGDVEEGFRKADIITEGTYSYENITNPLPPEPLAVIATWEGPDKVTLWAAAQSPGLTSVEMLDVMGSVDYRIIATQCGGSYGSKGVASQVYMRAAALAKTVGEGSLVKVSLTKEEQFDVFNLRLGSRIHGRVGMKNDATVTAFSGEWLINTGAFSQYTQAQAAVGMAEAQVVLRCANWDLQVKTVFTNRNASGIVKGFGGQELQAAFLPLLTEAMEKLDIDPVEFFKKNFVKPGDGYFWRDGIWWVCRGIDYLPAMEKGAEVFGWSDKWKGWLKPTAANGARRIGVGVGVQGNADAGESTSEAYVRLSPLGTAVLHVLVAEPGCGQRSSLHKMVAETLLLPLESVSMTPPDTLVNPFDMGLIGSRGTRAIGTSVTEAAEDAKQKLLAMAAPILGVNPEDLETEDGMVYVKGNPQARIPWMAAMGGPTHTVTGLGYYETDHSTPNFFMIFVEVEVDIETGKTDLLRCTGATDVGQIIDPISLKMQLEGSLGAAGIDSALVEETVIDQTTGHILSGNMIDYKWRTYLELPTFQNVILETPFEASHRFKALGMGEITGAPGPAAILMAVSNAIGVRIMDYPFTPDRILKALGKI